ncbi:hypothetical protein Tco_1189316 [Tanacetum coccineum]
MSSIIAQQAKLNLELVSKEKRLEIRKCNGRLNPRKIQREPTFQVVLDALALTPCLLMISHHCRCSRKDLEHTGEIDVLLCGVYFMISSF